MSVISALVLKLIQMNNMHICSNSSFVPEKICIVMIIQILVSFIHRVKIV